MLYKHIALGLVGTEERSMDDKVTLVTHISKLTAQWYLTTSFISKLGIMLFSMYGDDTL